VTGFEGTDHKVVEVDANLEPEAFSTDGRALFVLQYKPALHPDRYQVRRLDIETGQLSDIFTSDKDIQGDMQGIARTQALSPDGTRLYTLYTKGDHEAFVHVLSLDAQVANCVDLPKPFGQTPDAMALATSPDGRSLYVADTAHGRVADINTDTLKVKRTARLSAFPSRSGPAAVAASDSAVYVARGGKVSAFGTVSFHRYATWRFDSAVRGLQLADSGESELYIAERERVTILDGRDGNRLHRFPIPTADGISHVGYVLPQTSIGSYQCAC
jgi:DNA-binding beta-propeller fold protein YncE